MLSCWWITVTRLNKFRAVWMKAIFLAECKVLPAETSQCSPSLQKKRDQKNSSLVTVFNRSVWQKGSWFQVSSRRCKSWQNFMLRQQNVLRQIWCISVWWVVTLLELISEMVVGNVSMTKKKENSQSLLCVI